MTAILPPSHKRATATLTYLFNDGVYTILYGSRVFTFDNYAGYKDMSDNLLQYLTVS